MHKLYQSIEENIVFELEHSSMQEPNYDLVIFERDKQGEIINPVGTYANCCYKETLTNREKSTSNMVHVHHIHRIYSPPPLHFKGAGFYTTDYK